MVQTCAALAWEWLVSKHFAVRARFPWLMQGSFCRDVLSLGITLAEHQKTILSGIQTLRAQVIQMHGCGVQV